jgi:hypothetical protein
LLHAWGRASRLSCIGKPVTVGQGSVNLRGEIAARKVVKKADGKPVFSSPVRDDAASRPDSGSTDGDAGHAAAGKVGHTAFATRAVFRLPALSMSDRSGESVEMG